MKKIDTLVDEYIAKGFTIDQARNFIAQQILLTKIEKSIYVDKVLLKGGVVMYNMTHELRRTTSDLDIDFIRYNILEKKNIIDFIKIIDKNDFDYHLKVIEEIKDLHQQNYKGKRVVLLISDNYDSTPIKFKIDIGIHTLLAIKQNKMCFFFDNDKELSLWVNPPEQIFAEKLFSLAKLGPITERYKDIDDMYYLITQIEMDIITIRDCLELLIIGNRYHIKDVADIITKADYCLNNSVFINNYLNRKGSWIDIDYNYKKKTILDFVDKF